MKLDEVLVHVFVTGFVLYVPLQTNICSYGSSAL
jgi:hypothetical protein